METVLPRHRVLKLGLAGVVAGPALSVLGTPPRRAGASPAAQQPARDAAWFWDGVLLEALLIDSQKASGAQEQSGPTRASRAAAIVSLALYNAVNGVRRHDTHYQDPKTGKPAPPGSAPSGAQAEAAGAGAAHAALSALFPSQRALFGRRLAEFRASAVAGAGDQPSIDFGARVAAQLLAARADDGADAPQTYTPPTPGRGVWIPDAVLAPPGVPLTPRWGDVRVLFDLPPSVPAPPPVPSGDYSYAFKMVLKLGANVNSERTPQQDLLAAWYSYDDRRGTPIRLYLQLARQVLAQTPPPPDLSPLHSPLHRHARFFALVTSAMMDAGVECWRAKYRFNLWRPFQGIRHADDGNPYTVASPQWLPLGRPLAPTTSPSFPAYPSGHAAFGAACFAMVGKFLAGRVGDLQLSSEERPEVLRYARTSTSSPLAHVVRDNMNSRVYLGVHWFWDDVAGTALGQQVADRMWDRYLRPVT